MYRRARITVKVDRWDWNNIQIKDRVDITELCTSVTWQKTIKAPDSGATVELIPQNAEFNVLDDLSVLDVILIYEFGKLKWQGYLRRVAFTGYMDRDGRPYRNAVLICESMGKLFSSSSIGLGLGNVDTRAENASKFMNAAISLQKKVADAMIDGLTYKECISTTIDAWMSLMSEIGAQKAVTHVQAYVDWSSLVEASSASVIPRSLSTFTGQEQKIDLWSVLTPLLELPVNECWLDVAPRRVFLSSGNVVSVNDDRTHLVFRSTPFNGTITEGVLGEEALFSRVPSVLLPNSHLTRFDLNKSLDEVFSVYDVVPSDFQFTEGVRYLAGQVVVDVAAVEKYLLKMLLFQPNYTRTANVKTAGGSELAGQVNDYAVDLANTFKNWYSLNDQFLSGAISYVVPDEIRIVPPSTLPLSDPRIGERIALQDLDGSFYVEGISHSWRQGGALTATASVTRGYDYDAGLNMKLSNKLFRSGLLTKIMRKLR